jgi:hypothetical protein
MAASFAAAQYCRPKISVIASPDDPRNIADRLEKLILEQRRKPKLIEARPQPDQQRIRRRI